MIGNNRTNKVLMKIFLLGGLTLISYAFLTPELSAQTYDFDEGIEVLTEGLVSKKRELLRNKTIAVFGIIESRSKKKLEISSHIEDGVVDVLVNEGYTVIERRRIDDVIKKEIKKSTDWWFNEAQVVQFGKLVGADVVVTGRYVEWGTSTLKISIRAINANDGKILGAHKVKVLTDRIMGLLKSGSEGERITDVKKAKNPFVGEWQGTTWCADPSGRKNSFRFDIWIQDGVIKCNDHSAKNTFRPAIFSEQGDRFMMKCRWYRNKSDKHGTYNFYIDKKNPNRMYGYENTRGIRCKQYEYELRRL